MSPEFDKVFSLERRIYTTWQEIKALEGLMHTFKEPRVLEFWDNSNITFYKEDVQALLDSKNRRAERLLNEMREILGEKEGE